MTDKRRLIPLEQGESTLVIQGDDIPYGAYQAIYHKLTKRVEKRRKIYRDAYNITLSDFTNLHERLTQLLKQFSVKSVRCQVTHELENDTSREHSSFDKFKLCDLSVRSQTSIINYQLDFLIVLPAEVPEASDIAQRYQIMIQAEQHTAEDEEIYPYYIRSVVARNSLDVVIEYADYAVSQSIHSSVESWIETIPARRDGVIASFFTKHESLIRRYSDAIARVAPLLTGIEALSRIGTVRGGLIVLLSAIAVSNLAYALVNGLVDSFYHDLVYIKARSNLLLTTGDIEREQNNSKKRKRAIKVCSFLTSGIFLTIILSVLSNYIYDLII